uniref:Uncharacterized protein n=1 Tax=Panagrolaimus sp. JU765 TaxID=591449 RepID=A0AC34RLP2_9BILA
MKASICPFKAFWSVYCHPEDAAYVRHCLAVSISNRGGNYIYYSYDGVIHLCYQCYQGGHYFPHCSIGKITKDGFISSAHGDHCVPISSAVLKRQQAAREHFLYGKMRIPTLKELEDGVV